jgi:TatD DNase family protein
MASIFDSHAHYDCEAFDEDRDILLSSMPRKNVCGILNAGTDIPSACHSIQIAEQYPFVWAAIGIHPQEAGTAKHDDLDELRRLYDHPRVVAIGEIGLDYYYEDSCPRSVQLDWFRRQLALAAELDAPVIVHDREAHEDTLRLLQEYQPKGVVHCFSGSVEMAREIDKLGMYIGLGGAVTFKNARKPVEVAAAVPLTRLLLETDAPYMTPVPFRGKRCDSGHIAFTAARIAEFRGIEVNDLLEQTCENTCRLFGIEIRE